MHLWFFQAGATSMWASCCGLLNEVMGTGAVRGQQTGFPGSTGPFRFTPSSDFPTYPPAATEGPNIVCKACGLSFSVFRKKVSLMKCCIQIIHGEINKTQIIILGCKLCWIDNPFGNPCSKILVLSHFLISFCYIAFGVWIFIPDDTHLNTQLSFCLSHVLDYSMRHSSWLLTPHTVCLSVSLSI